jgi:autotransporter-associated beta strand protein
MHINRHPLTSHVVNSFPTTARSSVFCAAIIALFFVVLPTNAQAQESTTNTNEVYFDPYLTGFSFTDFSDDGSSTESFGTLSFGGSGGGLPLDDGIEAQNQATVTYLIRPLSMNSSHTVNTSGDAFAGTFPSSEDTELGQFANQNNSSVAVGVASFRELTTDGTSGGTDRTMRVGDSMTINSYVNPDGSNPSGSLGITFKDDRNSGSFADYNSNQRLRIFLDNSGSWKIENAGTTVTTGQGKGDATITVKLISEKQANITIGGTTYYGVSLQNAAASGNIESFAIYSQTAASNSADNPDSFWRGTGAGNVMNFTDTGTVELGGSSSYTIDGVIADGLAANVASGTAVANTVFKFGTSAVDLTAANTFTGNLILEEGTIRVGNASALGTGTFQVQFDVGGTKTLSSASSAGYTLANNINVFNNFTIGQTTGGTGSLTLSGTFFLGDEVGQTRVLTVNGNHTISGNVTGARGIVKQGGGELTLSGANNTSSGGIFIDNGTINLASGSLSANGIDIGSGVSGDQSANNATLKISSASTFNENIVVNAEGTSTGSRNINFANANGTTATLSGTVSLEKQAFITVASGAEGSMTGIISGASGSIVKQGAGTLSLSGENTFATGLFIDSGVVNLAGGSLGTSTIDVGGGVNNNVVNAEDATLRVSAALTYSGNFTIHSETNSVGVTGARFIEFANAASTSAGLSGTVAANKTVSVNVVNSTASGSLTGVISGNGGLTKSGNGTLTLSGDDANTYSGATTISAGVLNLNKTAGVNAIAGSVSVGTGATLLISQSNQVANTSAVTLSGGTITRASGVSEAFGNLNVTTASFLNFSGGTGGTIEFSGLDYTPSSSVALQLFNFTQGNTLIIRNTSNWASEINSGFTFGGDGGFGSSTFSDGTFTITAIPEPSTYAAAVGLLAMFLWPARRRLLKDAKSILGLRAPARERLEAYRNT